MSVEMYVSDSDKISIDSKHKGHPSYLYVKYNGSESRVTVVATQHVYATDSDDGFELCDKSLLKDLCYKPFELKTLIIHDDVKGDDFREVVESELKRLVNE